VRGDLAVHLCVFVISPQSIFYAVLSTNWLADPVFVSRPKYERKRMVVLMHLKKSKLTQILTAYG
jgi:hypothetical protein